MTKSSRPASAGTTFAETGPVGPKSVTVVTFRLSTRSGFEKRTADPEVAVHGEAESDADFAGGGDRVRYRAAIGGAEGPFQVDAELLFQPIAYRWAMNLKGYAAPEPQRFVGYYEQLAAGSGVRLARASVSR